MTLEHILWIGAAVLVFSVATREGHRLWQRGWRMYVLSERQAAQFLADEAAAGADFHCPECGALKRSGYLCYGCGYSGEVVSLGTGDLVPMDVSVAWRGSWREPERDQVAKQDLQRASVPRPRL